MFKVVRLFINCQGENKIVQFDPRISLDDQNIKLMNLNLIYIKVNYRSNESLDDLF